MNRRDIVLALIALSGVPYAARAQPAKERVYTVGVLSPAASPTAGSSSHFLPELNALGYVEGRNLHVESRYAAGRAERLGPLADELVRLQVDVIAAFATTGALAAQKATRSIPIVMVGVFAPEEAGLVTSRSHPTGNITGVAYDAGIDVLGKRLEILKATLPGLRRAGLMAVASRSLAKPQVLEKWRKEGEAAGRSLGLAVRQFDLPSAMTDRTQWRELFRRAAAERVGAVVIFDSPGVLANRSLLIDAAIEHRIPTLFGSGLFVEAGGLIAYGTNVTEMLRRAASYVDRILKGAKPSDLPVEFPSEYQLSVNLKTAKALGLTIPQSVLLRANRVIE